MKFLKLKIKNFLSIGELTVKLDSSGIVLVLGRNEDSPSASSNGAGKSSLWDALSWCLFGKTLRGIGGDDVVNRFTGSDCSVILSVENGSGAFEIMRTRRSQEHGNRLIIYKSGTEISAPTIPEAQAQVDSVVGFSFDVFKTTAIFGQATLRFAQATDKEKKIILEDLLGITVFEEALRKLRTELNEKQSNYSARKSEIDVNANALEELKIRMLEAEQKSEQHDKRILAETLELSRRIECLMTDLSANENKKNELGKPNDEEETLRKNHSMFLNKRAEIIEASGLTRSEAAKLGAMVSSARDRIRESRKDISAIGSIKGLPCPTCFQEVQGEHVERITKIAEDKILEIEAEEVALDEKISKIKEQIKKDDEISNEMREAITQLEAELVEVNKRRKEFLFLEEASNSIRANIERAKITLEGLGKSQNPYSEMIKSFVLEQKSLEADITKATGDAGKIAIEMQYLKFWDWGFSTKGLRSYLLDSVVPFLNTRANHYSRYLTDGSVRIEFTTQKKLKSGELSDDFQVKAINQYGSDLYAGNSSGERQRVDFAVSLALNDLARERAKTQLNITIFDEVFEHLDQAGCERVVELLLKESSRWGSCFVVTHQEDLKQFFPKVIQLVKSGGVSRLEN